MSEKPKHPPTSAVRAARQRREAAAQPSLRTRQKQLADGGVEIDLEVFVREISEAGERVNEALPARWLTTLLGGTVGAATGWWSTGEGHLDLVLREETGDQETGDRLRLTGTGGFQLKHSCVRCLAELDFDLAMNVDLRLVEGVGEIFAGEAFDLDPQGLAGTGEEEGEPMDDDDDLVTFQGHVIDLAPIMREQIFLELPMHPRCDTAGMTAPGPCSFDAEGRAEAEADRWVDPRWKGLLAFKDKLKQ